MAFCNFWPFNVVALLCSAYKFRTMYADVLKFHIGIPHEKKWWPIFFFDILIKIKEEITWLFFSTDFMDYGPLKFLAI